MEIRTYLAMTPEEFREVSPLPPNPAWMACHFSPEGPTGLPSSLPPQSLVILDDRILPGGPADPLVTEEFVRLCSTADGLLLDFEHPMDPELARAAQALSEALPCPVAVSEAYAGPLTGPVFLSLVPPHVPLEERTAPWRGRELWLELGPGSEVLTLTASGAILSPASPLAPLPHTDPRLHCHYRMDPGEDRVVFSLTRTQEDLHALTAEAQALGVTRCVGLWQELNAINRSAP